MKKFHFSYDVADDVNVTAPEIAAFLINKLSCNDIEHPVKSTFIFNSNKDLDSLGSAIENNYPNGFFFMISIVEESCYRIKQNPTIESNYSKFSKTIEIQRKLDEKK